MKVYVITEGCYSNYHICGVALNEEKAEKIAKLCHGEVEEYDTQGWSQFLQGGTAYNVWVFGDGTTTVRLRSYFDENTKKEIKQVRDYNSHYVVSVIARDENHAKKIGTDLVAQYRYEHEVEQRDTLCGM